MGPWSEGAWDLGRMADFRCCYRNLRGLLLPRRRSIADLRLRCARVPSDDSRTTLPRMPGTHPYPPYPRTRVASKDGAAAMDGPGGQASRKDISKGPRPAASPSLVTLQP